MNKKISGAVSILLLLSGCATTTQSTLLGGAIGGAAGGLVGQSATHDSQGTMIGLAVGAGVGSLIAYFTHRDKSPAPGPASGSANSDDQMPELTRAKIRSIVVPDTIEGNKYIKSHRVFILDDAGSWSK